MTREDLLYEISFNLGEKRASGYNTSGYPFLVAVKKILGISDPKGFDCDLIQPPLHMITNDEESDY